jgi:hypothetical protein
VAELVQRHGLSLLDRLEGEVSPERLLATVPGIGPTLAARIHRKLCVEALEDLEAASHDGRLQRVAGSGPRRFNPGREAWLPILHAEQGAWHLTALFSNTARAHELGRTQDWVVIFCVCDGDEGQCTVVSETHGPLSGRRVVRGREAECREHYASIVPVP